jgi:hypothetical protein
MSIVDCGPVGAGGLWRQHGVSGALMSEEAKVCFVLPLREAVAHFACPNARSTDTEMGSSDDGNAHTSSIAMAANFGVALLPLLSKHGG